MSKLKVPDWFTDGLRPQEMIFNSYEFVQEKLCDKSVFMLDLVGNLSAFELYKYLKPGSKVYVIPERAKCYLGRGFGKTIFSQIVKNTLNQEWPAEPNIEKIIFADELITKIIWTDKTETIVRVQKGDKFDAKKGILECMYRKLSKNKNFYQNNILTQLNKMNYKSTKKNSQLLHDIILIQLAEYYFNTKDVDSVLDKLISNKAVFYHKEEKNDH